MLHGQEGAREEYFWYTITWWGPEHITHWFGEWDGARIVYQGGWARSFLREFVATERGTRLVRAGMEHERPGKGKGTLEGDVINEIHDGGCDVLDSSGRSMMDRRNPDCGH